jgi:hypothetical protein
MAASRAGSRRFPRRGRSVAGRRCRTRCARRRSPSRRSGRSSVPAARRARFPGVSWTASGGRRRVAAAPTLPVRPPIARACAARGAARRSVRATAALVAARWGPRISADGTARATTCQTPCSDNDGSPAAGSRPWQPRRRPIPAIRPSRASDPASRRRPPAASFASPRRAVSGSGRWLPAWWVAEWRSPGCRMAMPIAGPSGSPSA